MSIVEFSCLFCNTKISEFFDMTKSWAARHYRLTCSNADLVESGRQWSDGDFTENILVNEKIWILWMKVGC